MFPILIAIIITSNYFKWWPTFLAIAIYPLRETLQILQIWSIYSLNGLFSELLDFFLQKIIERYMCRLVKGNWRENGQFLAFSKHFLDNFQDCNFLSEICIYKDFFNPRVCIYYQLTFKKGWFVGLFWYWPKKLLEIFEKLNIVPVYY